MRCVLLANNRLGERLAHYLAERGDLAGLVLHAPARRREFEDPAAFGVPCWTWPDGDPLAVSRAGGQVILSAGAQGAGKSQALLSIIETALAPRPPLTSETLPPTAVLAFHCDLSGATLPELLHAAWPTQSAADREYLARHLGVAPRGLRKVRLLVPAESLEDVYDRVRAAVGELPPNLEIRPLRLRPHHLGARGLAALFGVDPRHPPRYLQELLAQALALGPALTTAALHTAILGCEALSRGQQARALSRLALLQELESSDDQDGDPWALCEPGVLSIVHLTGRWLSADHALPLIVALMNVFVQPSPRHGPLQRMIVLDEINELRGTPELWAALVVTARQIRHLGSVLWLSGQDLCNVPAELLGLATIVLCFRLRSPRVFEHLRRHVAGFARVRFSRVAALQPGQAIAVAAECSRPELRGRPLTIYVRPPSCAHGGHTRAVN